MDHKYLSLVLFLSFYLQGVECPSGFVKIEEVCYYKQHLDILQDFVSLNPSLKRLKPNKIGYQEWTNNQLTYLYLGNNNIETLPDSINLLRGLLNLDLRENQIKSLPEAICNIYPFYTEINLSRNQICPPYPYCFEIINRAPWSVYGTVESKPHTSSAGVVTHHRSNFRLQSGGREQVCSSGPFYDGYRLRFVLRTLIPIFECYTVANRDVVITGREISETESVTKATCY